MSLTTDEILKRVEAAAEAGREACGCYPNTHDLFNCAIKVTFPSAEDGAIKELVEALFFIFDAEG